MVTHLDIIHSWTKGKDTQWKPPPVRELSVGMRGLLVAASVLVFLAGFQLFILTEQTEHYFEWTIQPPLTAAFLGAGYWSSFLLEFLASRERIWARARVAVPAVFAFTMLTLVATLLHFDRFHFGSTEIFARVTAWFWLMIYLVVPPIVLVLWIHQQRLPRGEPASLGPFTCVHANDTCGPVSLHARDRRGAIHCV